MFLYYLYLVMFGIKRLKYVLGDFGVISKFETTLFIHLSLPPKHLPPIFFRATRLKAHVHKNFTPSWCSIAVA